MCDTERCICCGEPIPEGRQICPSCSIGGISVKEAALMIPWAQSYIGTPYSQMDCQAFIEACLRDIGINVNLSGSNAWYRRMDWVGTPEECKRRFGAIPPGAFLFIVAEVSDSTPGKYRDDGLGDAEHIGLYTNIGLGAIHSSSSKGCVCESKFRGKTIPHGGWNRVGLWTSRLKYWEEGVKADMYNAKVVGGTLNVRERPSTSSERIDRLADGTVVNVVEDSGDWSRIQYGDRTGWVQNAFLTRMESEDKIEVARSDIEAIIKKMSEWLAKE